MRTYLIESLIYVAVTLAVGGCVSTNSSGLDSHNEPNANRVPPIPLEMLSPRQRQVLGIVEGEPVPKRAMVNLHRTVIHNPDLMEAYYPLGNRIIRTSAFSDKQRELIILRAVWLYQDKWEWPRHYNNALIAGWTVQDIEQIKVGPDAPNWQGQNQILLRSVDQIVNNAFLEDNEWQGLRVHYSVADVLSLITLVTHFHWVATVTRSFGIDPGYELLNFD